MSRQLINRSSDYPVRVLAPVDKINGTLLNDAAGASSAFKVYDPSKDSVLSILESSGQTILSLASTGDFVVGDTVECTLDSGTIHTSTIASGGINTVDGEITIAAGITGNMAAGNRVRVIMGASVTMTEFGTPDIDTRDWGYEGVFSDTHAAQLDARAKAGFDVDLEIQFNGGAGLASLVVHCLTIKEKICDG